jgi:glycosyltransferase involved in cell wall biosynthesis
VRLRNIPLSSARTRRPVLANPDMEPAPLLSVIIPCLDEAANLPALVASFDGLAGVDGPLAGAELVLVDDGSSDDTWAAITRAQQTRPHLRSARHDRRLGIPEAWRTGLDAATADTVCVLDADLQYDPADVAQLETARRATGADVVQGSRAWGRRTRDLRFLASRALSTLLNRTFHMRLRDNKSGFFLCRRATLRRLLDQRAPLRHWQCFVMVAAHHAGLRIAEVEVPFHPRRAGRSAFGRVPVRATLEVLLDLPAALARYGGRA